MSPASRALGAAEGMATLLHFTATSIARAAGWFPALPDLWYLRRRAAQPGAGEGDPRAAGAVGQQVKTAEEAGIDGDIVEAEAWAYWAVRSLKGLPITWPSTTRAPQPMTGGVLYRA